jgi:hypothetical protein
MISVKRIWLPSEKGLDATGPRKLDADNPADREKLRRAVLDLVAGRKMPKRKGRG